MSLPDVLQALAELCPERFRVKQYTRTYAAIQARLDPALPGCGWDDVYDLAALNPIPLREWRWRLREALEQEIKARGWKWVQKCGEAPDTYVCRLYFGEVGMTELRTKVADTPAHALCLALLAALEAQP